MTEFEQIMSAITTLSEKLDGYDSRLKALEGKQEKLVSFQVAQAEKLSELSRQVEALASNPDNIVWSNGFQKGVEKEKVYDLINEQRLNRSAALDSLIADGVILAKRDYNGTLRRTPKVRVSPTKTQRVIIVLR